MKYLFVDTETNGLPTQYGRPYTDTDNWPMPVSIAWASYDDTGKPICEDYAILRQPLTELNPSAQAVHGITMEKMTLIGIYPPSVYDLFLSDLGESDRLIGHNLNGFDLNIIRADLYRNGLVEKFNNLNRPTFCTMRSTTEICKLPSPKGRGYKWPKLEELYRFCFGFDFQGAHNALSDVKATASCFFHLLEKGLIQP